MTDQPIRWEEPPPKQRGKGRGEKQTLAIELASRPGEWALIAENCPSIHVASGNANYFRNRADKFGVWEATIRKMPDGTWSAWAVCHESKILR